MIFEKLFEGEDLSGHIDYVDGGEFKSTEQDLLIFAQTAKIFHPMSNKLANELMLRKNNDIVLNNTVEQIYQYSVTLYAKKNNVQE
jgi:hypothetical protein